MVQWIHEKQAASIKKKGALKIRDIKRRTWCTDSIFTEMYEAVYAAMVEAGVARYSEEEKMLDINGNEVNDKAKMAGRPTRYELIHPEMVLFVDETGANTNQTTDKRVGRQTSILPADGSSMGTIGSSTDMHFTVLPFISGTGEAVLCAVILKSEKDVGDIPLNWIYGVDVTKPFEPSENEEEQYDKNVGEDKIIHGGPTCIYNGKRIPCYVCTSPKASITSQHLADMLEYIDSFNLFDRSDGKKPFLLLDGHHSRYEVPFLDYIHDEAHPWSCCIGVPYGTHIWQVGDSPQLNAAYKGALSKAKQKFFEVKSKQNVTKFSPTDIIPLVTYAWKDSFAISRNAVTAIAQRGWNPLNYCLVDHPDVRTTKRVLIGTKPNEEATAVAGDGAVDVNTSTGLAGQLIDAILIDRLKCVSAMESIQNERQNLITTGEQVAEVANVFRYSSNVLDAALLADTPITSGNCAKKGHFAITKRVRELAWNKQALIWERDDAKKARLEQRQETAQQQYMKSKEKARNNEVLTITDYKALVRHHWRIGDPKIPTKITELRPLWQQICGRLMMENPVPEVTNENIDATANVI
jgi:hypothetical protein